MIVLTSVVMREYLGDSTAGKHAQSIYVARLVVAFRLSYNAFTDAECVRTIL